MPCSLRLVACWFPDTGVSHDAARTAGVSCRSSTPLSPSLLSSVSLLQAALAREWVGKNESSTYPPLHVPRHTCKNVALGLCTSVQQLLGSLQCVWRHLM
eukprot:4548746-Amphidinium_carterae.1